MVITIELLVSDPVAAIVEMHPIGAILLVVTLPSSRSSSSKSFASPYPIPLAESMALPPPTGKIKSIFSSLHIRDYHGFIKNSVKLC